MERGGELVERAVESSGESSGELVERGGEVDES